MYRLHVRSMPMQGQRCEPGGTKYQNVVTDDSGRVVEFNSALATISALFTDTTDTVLVGIAAN